MRLSESEIQEKSQDCLADSKWWHAEDRAATELEVTELVAGLVRGLQPETCVETGCYRGQTSEAIGRALLSNGHGRLIALDTDGACSAATAARCVGLPVLTLCTDARRWTPRTLIDFAFIDTGDPADRLQDLDRLAPVLAPQAVVVVHDTGTQFGLREKLWTWAASNGFHVVLLPTPRGLAILRPNEARYS